MHSMTGFGQAQGRNQRHAVAVTVRSVNSRYLDLNLRLPEEGRAGEAALRELFAASLARGRVEVVVDIQAVAEWPPQVTVRGELVRALHDACAELAEEGLIDPRLTLGELLRLPEALSIERAAEAWDDDDRALLLEVGGRALAQLVAARRLEGGQLAAVLEERAAALVAVVARLAELTDTARREAAAALERRLAALLGATPVDPARLAQEAAVLADKSDVGEEVDRLAAHLDHFREVAAGGGSVGKRLDFLAQEILRELNTLGAKCRHADVTRALLDAKVLCEQLREQVQNVE